MYLVDIEDIGLIDKEFSFNDMYTYFDNRIAEEKQQGKHSTTLYYYDYIRNLFGGTVACVHAVVLYIKMVFEIYIDELMYKGYKVHNQTEKGYADVEW